MCGGTVRRGVTGQGRSGPVNLKNGHGVYSLLSSVRSARVGRTLTAHVVSRGRATDALRLRTY